MIASLGELFAVKELYEQALRDVDGRGLPRAEHIALGIMVEVPSVAVMAHEFADHAEFFSIGTNDLVQYTLAVDRGNVNLAARFTPLHPAVLRLVKRTVDVGRAAGLEVAVCGEMASQPVMAFALIGLGVRQLSVAPRAVTLVKHIVRGISVELAAEAAEAALAADNAAGAERQLAGRLRAAFGDATFLGDGLLVS
jgi:phosphotransferase system enzyme I (PtsI)